MSGKTVNIAKRPTATDGKNPDEWVAGQSKSQEAATAKPSGQVKTVRERGMRRLTIDVPAELHKKLKKLAADEDTTLAILVRGQLDKLVEKK